MFGEVTQTIKNENEQRTLKNVTGCTKIDGFEMVNFPQLIHFF